MDAGTALATLRPSPLAENPLALLAHRPCGQETPAVRQGEAWPLSVLLGVVPALG